MNFPAFMTRRSTVHSTEELTDFADKRTLVENTVVITIIFLHLESKYHLMYGIMRCGEFTVLTLT